jgi:septal ring factor EnvC (AmiA/AmiB activator)
MKDTKFREEQFRNGTFVPRMYSHNIQPMLQSLLSTLADIDFDYELERERLSNSSPDINLKVKALEKLKAQHRERREPYIRQLAILQQRMMELRAQ